MYTSRNDREREREREKDLYNAISLAEIACGQKSVPNSQTRKKGACELYEKEVDWVYGKIIVEIYGEDSTIIWMF